MTRYSIEPKARNMLKDIGFCQVQEISLTNMKTVIGYCHKNTNKYFQKSNS